MLQKLNANTNALTWFEIPVEDIQRAQKFYETILDIKLETVPGNPAQETLFFPRKPDTIMAQSGILSGALVKSEHSKPGKSGPLIYLNATPSIETVLDKIESAGGKIISPKTKIPAGLIAVFDDTEGNRLALHAAA